MFWASTWELDSSRAAGSVAGLLLLRAMRETASLGACGVSASASPVYGAARFARLRVPRYVLVVRAAPVLERKLGHRRTARVAAWPFDLAARLRQQMPLEARGHEIRCVDRFDARVDEVDATSRGGSWFVRDHRELNLVLEHPWDQRNRYIAALLMKGGHVAGYALTRMSLIDGVLTGTVIRAAALPTALPALLPLLIRELVAQGVALVEFPTAHVDLTAAARATGMRERGFVEFACRFSGSAGIALRKATLSLESLVTDGCEGDMLFL